MSAKILKVSKDNPPTKELLEAVREVISGGGILAFPTDTVYGIGGSGLAPKTADKVFTIKKRDVGKALPILIHSLEEARRWTAWNSAAEALAGRFWPGPLTLVLEPTPEGRRLLTSDQPTLAVRVPALVFTRTLIAESRAPWMSSSANLSGEPALTDGAAVAAALKDSVDLVIDAGPTSSGVVSSVVAVTGNSVRVLREGALNEKEILQAL
ncbi:MAG: L-threonylcarbamoyladenylate synthase [Elusimicrobiota bacterium]